MQLVVGEGRMANEQIIYLGPEEELTTVRERLEHTQAGRIMLVIPPQTQLRSHVGWRLLHSRMREMGKDVLVISSDRQIRAVAKEAGFRVADSQESTTSSKSRPSSRQTRTDVSGKTSQRIRKQQGKSIPDNRSIRPRQQPNQSRQASYNRPQTSQSRNETGSTLSRSDKTTTGPNLDASSSTFDIQDLKFDTPYGFHIDTSPPIRPLVPGQREDDELDPYMEDYHVAQQIRESAHGGVAGAALPAAELPESSVDKPEQASKISQANPIDDALFPNMEDIQPAPLPEQRASTFIPDISDVPTDIREPDISDVPTDVREPEIEDLGDEGDIRAQQNLAPHSLVEPKSEEPDRQEMPRIQGMTPGNNQTENMVGPTIEDLDDEDELLPIQDQPTRITPTPSARPSGAITPPTPGKREPQPLIQPPPQARKVTVPPTPPPARQPVSSKGSRTVTTPPITSSASSLTNRKGARITAIVFISSVVLLLAVLAFLFFGSNATVTIIVPTQSLNVNTSYQASTNPHDTQHNTIPSQVLTYTASVPGQGSVTGSVKQGNATATGSVIFTNKGSQPLSIPTGTVLSTTGAAPVLFVTTANPLVEPQGSGISSPPVPVQALNAGENGNVAANSITIIPPDSITKIAQNNQISSSTVNLSVTNPGATNGGGATNVQAVTSNDANILKKALHQQLQAQINTWLAKVVHQNDIKGKLMPDVLGNTNPLADEKLVTTPAVGQPATAGKFTGVLSVNVSMLVIRDAAIQAAGRAKLMEAAQKMNPVSVLAPQRPVNVTVTKSTPSTDGTALSINVTATGQSMQQVSTQNISNLAAGKSVDQAKSDIMNGKAGINTVVDTKIDMFPPFLGFMPFRPEQVHVIVLPGPVKGIPNG